MCNTCGGKGVIHITEGAAVKFHHCYDCPPEERAARRKRFEERYERLTEKAKEVS